MIDTLQEAANQYYILEIGLLMLLNNTDVVEDLGDERRNLAGTKFLMKTKDGLVDIPELSEYTALSHEQALRGTRGSEWNIED